VQSIDGLASTSVSPSDLWVLQFKPHVTYNGQPLESAFLKIAVNPDYLDTPANQGLRYELKVYTEVVEELLDRRICPHFVRCLMGSSMCHFDDLLYVATAGIDPRSLPPGAEPEYVANVLVENIAFMTARAKAWSKPSSNSPRRISNKRSPRSPRKSSKGSSQRSSRGSSKRSSKGSKQSPQRQSKTSKRGSKTVGTGRPSITNFVDRPDPPALVRDVDAVERIERVYRYVCIMNERPEVMSLSDWLAKDVNFKYEDFLAVVFQLIVTLWVMELRKMVHYDLHTGNVLIERTRPQRLGYVLNGKEYKVNTMYFVRVFDYDQSYVVSLGCNRWHVEQECQFVPNLDLARLLCDMFTDLKVSRHRRATKLVRTLEEVFGVRRENITPHLCFTVKASATRKTVPNASGVPQDLLRDCLPRLEKRMEEAVGPADTFAADERMFRPNGELRSPEEYELLLEKKQLENPAKTQDWVDLTDSMYSLQSGMQQLKREVERVNAENGKGRDKAALWGQIGTAVGAFGVAGQVINRLVPK
jgi:hypothetical protein